MSSAYLTCRRRSVSTGIFLSVDFLRRREEPSYVTMERAFLASVSSGCYVQPTNMSDLDNKNAAFMAAFAWLT